MIGAQSVTEGALLAFSVSASDPDATTPTLNTSSLPLGASFVDNGDGTGDFSWIPDFLQAGVFSVTFVASDGNLTDLEVVEITVIEAGNQSPVLTAIGPQSITENSVLAFGVSSSDPDGSAPTLTAAPLPTGATFIDNGDGTGDSNWTPDFNQAGGYTVTFVASDGALADSEVVTITVNEAVNQPPVLDPIGARSVAELSNLNFVVTATDANGTTPSMTTLRKETLRKEILRKETLSIMVLGRKGSQGKAHSRVGITYEGKTKPANVGSRASLAEPRRHPRLGVLGSKLFGGGEERPPIA